MSRISSLTLAAGMALSAVAAPAMTTDEAKKAALDAYVYGYSLITTEVTRVQMTNVDKADGLHAPMGQFFNIKRYPPADYRGVSAPNADTLYSLAWMDLDKEPWVFSHPDMGNRYYLFPTYSLWVPVIASPGARTAGGKAASYLLAGPGWKGEVPAGLTKIDVPTRYVLILGRTFADGTDKDYAEVNALQDQYDVRPLSAYGKTDYVFAPPPVDPNPGYSMTDKPQEVILAMDTETYFNKMATLMCHDAPPAPEDAPIVAEMAKIGLEPCKPFSLAALGDENAAALKDLPQQALDYLGKNEATMGVVKNGWVFSMVGTYGTDYLKRAVLAAFGWPANLPQDAVYPYTLTDKDGQSLTGANKYTLTFAKGEEPPVDGFWSITMYEIDKGWWFVPNPLNKFTVSPRNNLVPNAD